jgi:hypothetical protein
VLEVLTVLAVIVAGKELACNGHDGEETIGLLQINNGLNYTIKLVMSKTDIRFSSEFILSEFILFFTIIFVSLKK